MNPLETFLMAYSGFVTMLLLTSFIAMRSMIRTITFWKHIAAAFEAAYMEMAYLAANYRESYERDVVKKETDDATRR